MTLATSQNPKTFREQIGPAVWLLALLLLPAVAFGQVGVRHDDIILNSRGTPIGGANVSICNNPGLATSGAQIVANSILNFTVSSSAGFVVGKSLTVSGFTGADAFLNGSYTIASVSPTTIAVTVNHANYTAVGNGFVFQTGDSVTPCAPFASIFSDMNLTVPITQPGLTSDGIGNVGWYGAAGQYFVQYSGPGISTQVKPVTLSVPPGGTIANATNLVGPGSITGTFGGSPTLSVPLTSTVATGTAPLSVASTTNVPNLNASTLNGKAPPSGNIVGDTDAQALTNKTFDISANTLKNSINTAGHYPRNNGTQYVDATIAAADLPATTAPCTGVQLAIGLNAGGTSNCATPPTFVASGGSHAVGYVPDPGSSAGTTRFLREDATWVAPAGGGVTESTLSWGSNSQNQPTAACTENSTGNIQCLETFFANAHTLVRLTYTLYVAAGGCSTNAVVGLQDVTASSTVSSLTVTTVTGFKDSGALSVSMTAGHKYGLWVITAAAGCTTTPSIGGLTAVFQ